jgi:hypothetical protein
VWPDLREEMPLVWSIARAGSNLLSVALDQVAAVGRRFLTPLCRAREPRIAELLRVAARDWNAAGACLRFGQQATP